MEMSSTNPVYLLPEALRTRSAQIAGGLFSSFMLGVGQFCTKPGLVFLPNDASADTLVAELVAQVKKGLSAPMLTEGICRSYKAGIAQREGNARVEVLARAARTDGAGPVDVSPVLFQVSAIDLL
jgi:NADP-dependent aldehyde dehydrogenase